MTFIPVPTPPLSQAPDFRMPSEWDEHYGTWISWPREDSDSFSGKCPGIYQPFRELVQTLARSERVFINVRDAQMETEARHWLELTPEVHPRVHFHHHPTDEPWCRDHGPVFLTDRQKTKKLIVDWDYNAWGEKYPPFDRDNDIPRKVAQLRNLPILQTGMVLEGGSVDVNGQGLLMTTETCLLNPNRNPALSQKEIEARLQTFLGVREILWLGEGIVGDDTDGHIDDITRFVDESTIVTAMEHDPLDANYEALNENRRRLDRWVHQSSQPFEIVHLPMPSPIVQNGIRLPASYANFYIANRVVIVPTFNDPQDGPALEILGKLFPHRTVVGLDSRKLVWGLGSFHCLTQQEPLILGEERLRPILSTGSG